MITIEAHKIRPGDRIAYPYPCDDFVYDVRFNRDNEVHVITGDNGTGSRFFDWNERVPVTRESAGHPVGCQNRTPVRTNPVQPFLVDN